MAKCTFNFTGATQTFIIPSGVSNATIKVWGGGGGCGIGNISANNYFGGNSGGTTGND